MDSSLSYEPREVYTLALFDALWGPDPSHDFPNPGNELHLCDREEA